MMTPFEIKALVWLCVTLFSVVGFIIGFMLHRLTRALDDLSADVGGIKEEIAKIIVKHESQESINVSFERRIEKLEEKLY